MVINLIKIVHHNFLKFIQLFICLIQLSYFILFDEELTLIRFHNNYYTKSIEICKNIMRA